MNSTGRIVTAVKSIQFRYTSSHELDSLFEEFRLMCNDAIRIALQEKPKSKFSLIELAYSRLKEYQLHTHYIHSACEVAYSVFRNKQRRRNPYVRRAFLKLDSQSYTLNHLILRIPSRPRCFIYLTLQASNHHTAYIDDRDIKKGSLTVTGNNVSIALSKKTVAIEPVGRVGADMNEKNVTAAATDGYVERFSELGEVADIKERHREIKAKIGRLTRQDRRTSQRLYAKYGRRERNRTTTRLHRISKSIVNYATSNRLGIVMERLTGIRKLYRKGNGQGNSFRGRMNGWTFHEIQRQIEYKAKWNGIPVTYVSPRGSSRKCPDCGSRVVPLQERKLFCPECDKTWDRDVLASMNLMACAVPQARPLKGSSEGERGGDGSNPPSRWAEVNLVGNGRPPG